MRSVLEPKWYDIPNYEGLYQITQTGEVRSLDRIDARGNRRKGKPMSQPIDRYGYPRTHFRKNGRSVSVRVHNLAAETFIPNPDNKPCVDHINGIKTDNRVENLRWVTYEENSHNPITRQRHLASLKSVETRHKMSVAKKGKYHPSEETRRKLSEAHKGKYVGENSPNYGKHLPEETRRKIGEAQKGKHLTDETRRKLSEAHMGKHLSEKHRRKISEASIGDKNHFYGKHHTDEARRKMSEGHIGVGCKKIVQLSVKGEYIRTFESIKEAADYFGINRTSITNCCCGRNKTAYGYKWKYLSDYDDEKA